MQTSECAWPPFQHVPILLLPMRCPLLHQSNKIMLILPIAAKGQAKFTSSGVKMYTVALLQTWASHASPSGTQPSDYCSPPALHNGHQSFPAIAISPCPAAICSLAPSSPPPLMFTNGHYSTSNRLNHLGHLAQHQLPHGHHACAGVAPGPIVLVLVSSWGRFSR